MLAVLSGAKKFLVGTVFGVVLTAAGAAVRKYLLWSSGCLVAAMAFAPPNFLKYLLLGRLLRGLWC
jgi:hypothetical protein